jgi:hypothetical protein
MDDYSTYRHPGDILDLDLPMIDAVEAEARVATQPPADFIRECWADRDRKGDAHLARRLEEDWCQQDPASGAWSVRRGSTWLPGRDEVQEKIIMRLLGVSYESIGTPNLWRDED